MTNIDDPLRSWLTYTTKPAKEAAIEAFIIACPPNRTLHDVVHFYRSNGRGLEAKRPQFALGFVALAEQGFIIFDLEAKEWRLADRGRELSRLTRGATDYGFRPAVWRKAKLAVERGDETMKAKVLALVEEAIGDETMRQRACRRADTLYTRANAGDEEAKQRLAQLREEAAEYVRRFEQSQ
jgi:hypothetical protein